MPPQEAVDPVSGANWEGTGVQPDVPVPAGQAFDAAYALALADVLRFGGQGARKQVRKEARQALAELKTA